MFVVFLSFSSTTVEAIADYSKAIETNPNLESAYVNRAGDYDKIGEHAKALKDSEIIVFKTSLYVSKKNHFTRRKQRFLAKSCNSRMASRKPLILAHRRARLGFRNRRFQNIAFRFKKQSFYERKTAIFGQIMQFANGA